MTRLSFSVVYPYISSKGYIALNGNLNYKTKGGEIGKEKRIFTDNQ